MIHTLGIKNFKSIKAIQIPCKKINVFIGEPNGGKSNILEALSLLSIGVMRNELSREVIRYNTIGDLFFDFNINKSIELKTDEISYILSYSVRQDGVPENDFNFSVTISKDKNKPAELQVNKLTHDGKLPHVGNQFSTPFKYYQYKRLNKFHLAYLPFLEVPNGENLPSLLLSNESLRNWTSDFFQSKGFNLNMKPTENEINISKIFNNNIYSYPYYAISETLQRVVFYSMAIKSNKESILLFDEPETNTFPFYTKYLGERIALDESNQFFITTHNPYMLLSLIEKSTERDINVCVVSMKNFETKINVLDKNQIEILLDLNVDAFLNLDRILENHGTSY